MIMAGGKMRYRYSEKNYVITTVSTNSMYTALETNQAILDEKLATNGTV